MKARSVLRRALVRVLHRWLRQLEPPRSWFAYSRVGAAVVNLRPKTD